MSSNTPEVCTGVQILLSRMESNPEEFSRNNKKWAKITDALRNYKQSGSTSSAVLGLNKDELSALYIAYTQILRKEFTDSILREVLSSEEKELSHSMTSAPPTVLGNSHGGSVGVGNGGYTHAQQVAVQQAYLARQAAQMNAYQNSLGGAGQGLLSSLFGDKK